MMNICILKESQRREYEIKSSCNGKLKKKQQWDTIPNMHKHLLHNKVFFVK